MRSSLAVLLLAALVCNLNNRGTLWIAALRFPIPRKNNDKEKQSSHDTANEETTAEASPKPPPTYEDYPFVGKNTSPTNILDATTVWLASFWDRGQKMAKNHLKMQKKFYQRLIRILLYKPPVGIVTVWTMMQLISSGRIFRVYDDNSRQNTANEHAAGDGENGATGEGVMKSEHRKSKRRRNKGRALTLEERDQSYNYFGIVERVRGRLCSAALSDIVEREEELHPDFARERAALFRGRQRRKATDRKNDGLTEEQRMVHTPWTYGTALDALQLSCPPGGSRYDYIDQLRDPLSILRAAELTSPPRRSNRNASILQAATRVLEMRAMDAILRELRDGLLETTYRLARTVSYWERRVQQAKAMAVFQQILIKNTIEGDRLRLSYANAAYDAELNRLGRICSVLLFEKPTGKVDNSKPSQNQAFQGRPIEMPDKYILRALQESQDEKSNSPGSDNNTVSDQYYSHYTRRDKQKWRRTWRLPKFSRYSLRFERGLPKLIHLGKETFINGNSAIEILVVEENETLCVWYNDAGIWIREAQAALCDVLEDTLEGSVPKKLPRASQKEAARNDLTAVRDAWNICGPKTRPSEDTQPMEVANSTKLAWGKLLALVEDVRSFRRIGEGRSVALRDLSIVGWLSGFDAFGLPSALLKIYSAHLLHTLVFPYWPEIQSVLKEAWEACVTIFFARFWEPGKDVLNDILNREKSTTLDDFNILNEEHSLDVMLKDLMLGDGTPASRAKAVEAATRQYENDLRSGLFRHVASGHLLRLLLVQVQQLKVGLLNAIADIDVLISGNKLNVRLLATIPAIIIITLATRFFARNLYNLRSRDIRPISKVHAEMTEHLHRMKTIILLADGGMTNNSSSTASNNLIGSAQLGELALKMHCYLVLLDYCSPQPFPKSQCDAIHRSMQDILGALQKRRPAQAMIDIVMTKHQELQKNL